MTVKCYWIKETGETEVSLRRYRSSAEASCPGPGGYHNAKLFSHIAPTIYGEIYNSAGHREILVQPEIAEDHPRWPVKCDACDYRFVESDRKQTFTEQLYVDAVGLVRGRPLRDWGPGAMWDAWWMPDTWKGADGKSLMVKCPNGREWAIDSRASNCTLPDDTLHRCWVRHGEPPEITVDKNGLTCAAGAGSIQAGSYHGFLQNGSFT